MWSNNEQAHHQYQQNEFSMNGSVQDAHNCREVVSDLKSAHSIRKSVKCLASAPETYSFLKYCTQIFLPISAPFTTKYLSALIIHTESQNFVDPVH